MPTGSRSRTLLFSLITLLILFVGLELVLRLVVKVSSGYLQQREEVTYKFKLWQMHLFDSFMGMHESDPELFWRLKPNYHSDLLSTNSQGFIGPEIGPKQPGEFRVLFLGDSTPLGIGLADWRNSFVFQLQKLLSDSLPGRKITVINAATAGYTSWQCRRLLELRGEKLKPDLVVTYCGNNDPSINGTLSDRQLSELTSEYAGIKRILGRSYIYQLLRDLWFEVKSGKDDQKLVPRVSESEFADNLRAIENWCGDHNAECAFCTVPVPLLWPPGIEFKPFSNGLDKEGRLVMAADLREQLGAQWALILDTLLLPGRHDVWTSHVYAQAYSDNQDPPAAERFYESGLETDPDNAQYLNNLAVLRWRKGGESLRLLEQAEQIDSASPVINYNLGVLLYHSAPDSAHTLLESARQLDNFSLRIKHAYNDTLREVSRAERLPLVQLAPLLDTLPDAQAFVDHCHPTLWGHKLIAGKLLEDLKPLIAQPAGVIRH